MMAQSMISKGLVPVRPVVNRRPDSRVHAKVGNWAPGTTLFHTDARFASLVNTVKDGIAF